MARTHGATVKVEAEPLTPLDERGVTWTIQDLDRWGDYATKSELHTCGLMGRSLDYAGAKLGRMGRNLDQRGETWTNGATARRKRKSSHRWTQQKVNEWEQIGLMERSSNGATMGRL